MMHGQKNIKTLKSIEIKEDEVGGHAELSREREIHKWF